MGRRPVGVRMRRALLAGTAMLALAGALWSYDQRISAVVVLPMLVAAFAAAWLVPADRLRARLRAAAWTMGIVGVLVTTAALTSTTTCYTEARSMGDGAADPTSRMSCTSSGIPVDLVDGAFLAGLLALCLLVAAVARARPFAERPGPTAPGPGSENA